MILRSRDKDFKYEAEIASMKSDMTALAGESITLRTRVYSGSTDDEALRAKCAQLAIEHESTLFHI